MAPLTRDRAENRARLTLELTKTVMGVWGAGRVGIRLSRFGNVDGISASAPEQTFATAYRLLDPLGLAYLHVVESFPGSEHNTVEAAPVDRLRSLSTGTYIASPDLPERYRTGTALNAPDQATFYGGGTEGYIDYPSLDRKAA